MSKYVPRGKYLAELARLKPNKSFGTYKREEYVTNEAKRPAPVLETLKKRRRDEESISSVDDNDNDDIEELLLPAPIPNLPPVQPETFSSYEYDIPEYGESSDDENNIDDVPLIVPGDSILDDDTNTDFVINRTFTVASNENETEVHEREKEDIP